MISAQEARELARTDPDGAVKGFIAALDKDIRMVAHKKNSIPLTWAVLTPQQQQHAQGILEALGYTVEANDPPERDFWTISW